MSARLSPIHRAHPLIPVCRSAGTHTTATPAVAQILWTGSITLSALIRVNKRKSSMDDNSRCSSNGATSNPRAMSSVSRTQAAMASSLARNFCVCLYVTLARSQTDLQLSGEETPKKLNSTSASERPDGNENLRRRISCRGKRCTQWLQSEALESSLFRATASLKNI